MFGLGKQKCEQCGVELKTESKIEWQDKKFCCKDCKQDFRHRKSKGGGCCH